MRASATATAAVLAAAICAGCGGEPDRRERAGSSAERPRAAERGGAPADGRGALREGPPDAGTRAGHGADRRRVRVPERDASPPAARIVLARPGGAALAEAAMPGAAHAGVVTLAAPRLAATAIGADPDGGVARVRVSLRESVTCERAGGPAAVRLRTRYFPPPQIERIRSAPGTPLPVERRRSRSVRLALERCPRGTRAAAVRGELWAEAINGSGLEAVTPHLRLRWTRDAQG